MKNSRSFFFLAICLFLPLWASQAQENKIEVKRAWPPGVYEMTQTSKSRGVQTVGSQSSKTGSTDTMVWELRVNEPNAQGEKKIMAKIVKCQITEEGDSPSSYSSEVPAGRQNKDDEFVYRPLVGANVEITLDSDDDVIEVIGLDKLWTELSARASTEGQKGRLAGISIALGDKTVEQSLRRLESIVPKKTVATGEKWTAGIRSDLPFIGDVKQRFDCSLKGVEETPSGKLAVVQVEGKYETTKPRQGKIQGQEVMVSSLDVSEKGDVKFDIGTGIAAVDEKTLNVSAVLDATDEKGQALKVMVKNTEDVRTVIIPDKQAAIKQLGKADSAAGKAVLTESPGLNGLEEEPEMHGSLVPDSSSSGSTVPEKKSAAPASLAPVNYVVFRYIDQGGLQDQATGEWLEAFRMLMPRGWKFQGGLRWMAKEKRAGQLSKTDVLMPVKSDYAVISPDSRYAFRSYLRECWVDTSRLPASFKAGQNYNGMIVSPVVTPEQYISDFVYPRQHGQVSNLKVVNQEPLPKLAELYAAETARFNQAMAATRVQSNLTFKAGSITIDYTDGNTPCRETFVVVIQYIDTSGMVMFWPRVNFSFRTPREEFDRWLPVFTTISASVQNNPVWELYLTKLTQRAAVSQREVDDYCHRVQREIADSHSATTSELARAGGYLSSPYHSYKGTDGNRYYLPTDKYHFMNSSGELLSQDSGSPPSSEWKSIEPYNQ